MVNSSNMLASRTGRPDSRGKESWEELLLLTLQSGSPCRHSSEPAVIDLHLQLQCSFNAILIFVIVVSGKILLGSLFGLELTM